jgi:hypothetical protein
MYEGGERNPSKGLYTRQNAPKTIASIATVELIVIRIDFSVIYDDILPLLIDISNS